MNIGPYLAVSPLIVVSLGGALLMLSEAFSHRREESHDRRSGPSSDIALGTARVTVPPEGRAFSEALGRDVRGTTGVK